MASSIMLSIFKKFKYLIPMHYKPFLLLLLCLSIIRLSAQNEEKKLLYNDSLKIPLDYAHISYSLGSSKGTVSNLEGYFIAPVSHDQSDSITISLLGYATTKISHGDLQNIDTIFIAQEGITLSEITIVDHLSLLQRVKKELPNNYPLVETTENYFMRYFVKRNVENIQRIETLLELNKNRYFGEKSERKQEVELLANLTAVNIRNIDNVQFVPFTYDDLFSKFDNLINFDENYEFESKNISDSITRISFINIDSTVVKTGAFDGYIVVNQSDKAILELFYQKRYTIGLRKELKQGYKQEPIYFSNRRKWKKANSAQKYRLELMEVNGELLLTNATDDQVNDHYEYSCLLQNSSFLTVDYSRKRIKTNRKRALNRYKDFNEKAVEEVQGRIVLRTKEQDHISEN